MPASRNPHPESVQLNKNSGSDEALNPAGAAEPISAEVDEMYGYEYGGEDYGAEQEEQPAPEAEDKKVSEKLQEKVEAKVEAVEVPP